MVVRQVDLAEAILATVAYSDVFQYPLTLAELRRYLIGARASEAEIAAALAAPELAARLEQRDGLVAAAGRASAIATRRRRAATAAQMWPRALRYARALARLPFVRMVALTGALAVDNVEPGADIDYLIVTEPGRLWVCRLLTIALVRLAALRGDIVCPNYFLAETALELDDQSLYAAHELAHMQPLAGVATYARLRAANAWADEMLPNAAGAPRELAAEERPGRLRRAAEAALRTPLGGMLERWEMRRKLRKFSQQGGNLETAFSPEWCKGHFDGHGRRVMAAYAERLERLGVEVVEARA